MNCGPAKKAPVYSYTGQSNGDFVIWKGEQFVANIGGSSFAEVGKQQIAFDVDKAHAELIVNALNDATALSTLQAELVELRKRVVIVDGVNAVLGDQYAKLREERNAIKARAESAESSLAQANERVKELEGVALGALHEMRFAVSPFSGYSAAVDELDRALKTALAGKEG